MAITSVTSATSVRDRRAYTEPLATGEVFIDASPEAVYRLVSDPVRMAGFAEEFFKARWIRGATGPAVGSWFAGTNRNGWRRWVTHSQITEAEPGRRFVYRVRARFLMPISRWEYDIVPEGAGCRLVVKNWLRAPVWFVPVAILITGHKDRPGTNRANIEVTLLRLKAYLEG